MNYYPLGNTDNKLLVRILQVVFGAACIIVAALWMVIGLKNNLPGSAYLAVVFIVAFGAFMVWSGAGKAKRYVNLGTNKIVIRENPVRPAMKIMATDMKLIEIYPLSIKFLQASGRQHVLRLGTINFETNEKIVDSVIRFAEENNIKYEIIED